MAEQRELVRNSARGVRPRRHCRGGRRAALRAGLGRGDAAEAGREGARRPREGRDAGAEGREFFDRQRDNIAAGDRTRPRGVRTGAQGDPVTDWQTVYLAAMAVALVLMAAIQIGLIVVAIRGRRGR